MIKKETLTKLYRSAKGNCCKCGCALEDNTGNGLGSVFVLDRNGNFYCARCDWDFSEYDERIFELEEGGHMGL